MLEDEEDFGDTSIADAVTRDSSSSSTPILYYISLSAVLMKMERSRSRAISNHLQAL